MPHATENSSATPPSSSSLGITSSSSSSNTSIDSYALQQFAQQHARDDHWSAYAMRFGTSSSSSSSSSSS
ncbi:hypothetical protein TMEN_2297 [Trichophyton mentagrophytes]|uniref:Uncharacterized protein n=2 Tax=Trichophyton interdigitale TaxID=101480 RepID=A0A9P4YJ17_9EURO|nr:hypothetical protein GY631_3042 [Trichophyton interdigitale]KAF3896601.1 hypothetical protein GY632_2717 [Trichophyton interdigitale]KAG8209391.1 hypothetical protein GTR04_3216 [Trichophyton interdigitale]KDB21184.1 hypothetical protein H109_06848 [Trichophyton interdigitale MR816]GBF59902.1 hypothetical protein TMEN_2297 [Trichophyton mentagrophytes]